MNGLNYSPLLRQFFFFDLAFECGGFDVEADEIVESHIDVQKKKGGQECPPH